MRHLFKKEAGAENFSKITKTGSFFRATRRTPFRARFSKDTGVRVSVFDIIFQNETPFKKRPKRSFSTEFFLRARQERFIILSRFFCQLIAVFLKMSLTVVGASYSSLLTSLFRFFSQLFYSKSIN